jgi:mRNA interferase MazF
MCKSGEIWKVKLYPTRGSEQDGVRPCLVISPDSMNKALQTVVVLPMTRAVKDWPSRVRIQLNQEVGQACIEHIRSVSKERLIEKIGTANEIEMAKAYKIIHATFSR